jgi:hypothetical protein
MTPIESSPDQSPPPATSAETPVPRTTNQSPAPVVPPGVLDAAGAAAAMSLPNDLPLAKVPEDLVHSSFDEADVTNQDLIPNYDPVPDRGPVTHSSFDDTDGTDYHPVP